MKKILILLALFTGLAVQASSFFGGDIPTGDKIRTSGKVSIRSSTDETILNLSNQGGLLHSITFGGDGGADRILNNIKVTVDGASERTLSYGIYTVIQDSGAGYNVQTPIYLPITYRTSLIVKVNQGASPATNGAALAIYSVK